MQQPLENCHGSNAVAHSLVPQDLTGSITKCDNQYCVGGSFGDVYRCKYRHGNHGMKEVAVKTFRFEFTVVNEDGRDDRTTRMIRRELGIWKRLNHPNIVPFLGVVSGFGRLGNTSLVSEWMPNGTLQDFLQNYDERLAVAHRLQLLLDIANGLEYLHSLSIVHGDLTPNNVLIDDRYTARLTDFGYSSLIGEVPEGQAYLQASTLRSGAVRWTAPERISHPEEKSHHCTTKSDIYSFGSLALLVLSGKRPWSDIRRDEAIIFQLFKGHKPCRPPSCPIDDQHWAFIEICWSSVQERPSAKQLKSSIRDFLRAYPLAQPFFSTLVSSTQNTSQSILGQSDDSGIAPSSSSSPFSALRGCLEGVLYDSDSSDGDGAASESAVKGRADNASNDNLVQDTNTASLDGDDIPFASGSLRAFANYDSDFDSSVDPQPYIAWYNISTRIPHVPNVSGRIIQSSSTSLDTPLNPGLPLRPRGSQCPPQHVRLPPTAQMAYVPDDSVVKDTASSSLRVDQDTTLSSDFSFLHDFANNDYHYDAFADPALSNTLAPTLASLPSIQSVQSTTPPVGNEWIGGLDYQARPPGCRWVTDGAPCEGAVSADRRSVVEHLQRVHGMPPGEEKSRLLCHWEGCNSILKKESLARHIMTVHLKENLRCSQCNLHFAREDSLQRHMKGGQHKGWLDKSPIR